MRDAFDAPASRQSACPTPAASMAARCWMSAADYCTNDSATISTPSESPKRRSSDVLRRQARGRQRHTWRVDALVLSKRGAMGDGRDDRRAVRRLDPEADLSVVEQQLLPRLYARRQRRVRRVDLPRPPHLVAGRQPQGLARLQRNRRTALQSAGANLGSCQLLENRDDAVGTLGGVSDPVERGLVGVVRP